MTHTVVKPDKQYSGPKNMQEMVKFILADARKEKRDISEETITSVLISFFSKYGLMTYIKQKKRIAINGFGTFVKTKIIRKKHDTVGKKMPRKRRPGVVPMEVYRRRMKKEAEENHLRRIIQCRNEMRLCQKKNEEIIRRGKKPWTFRQYCCVIHETELIAYEKIVKAVDRKKIDDLNAGIFEQGDIVILNTGEMKVFHSYINDSISCVCAMNNDYSPNVSMWNYPNKMRKVRTDSIKPYIDEKLFFL